MFPIRAICISLSLTRVEYVKLSEVLRAKGVCPVVSRFLVALYTKQQIRVKWGNCTSTSMPISNGVKQGGVLSPLLFTLYLDVLLLNLIRCGYGCYVQGRFMGACSYADDIILMSPTLYGTRQMLKVCEEFSQEFNVMFNGSKSKLIVVKCDTSTPHEMVAMSFMGTQIECVASDKHLGNIIGNIDDVDVIQRITNDFKKRVNMLKAHFRSLPVQTMYHLFKTYCMPLYGSQLMNLGSRHMTLFYTQWRKAIRFLFNLPYRTHSILLPIICNDDSIEIQMYRRFLSFFKMIAHSCNDVVNICYNLVISASGSAVSNSITFLCNKHHISRAEILSKSNIILHEIEPDPITLTHGSLLNDILNMRFDQTVNGNFTFLSYDECSMLIEFLSVGADA